VLSPAPPHNVDATATAPEQIARMDANTYFATLTRLMQQYPPPARDNAMVEQFKHIGIDPAHGFDPGQLDSWTVRGLNRSVKSATAYLRTAGQAMGGAVVNGWQTLPSVGDFGVDYPLRAYMAAVFPWPNVSAEAVYPMTAVDGQDKPLDGSHRYVLHFDSGQTPQHIGRAWVLPHPERNSPQIREMVTDPEIERIAVQHVIAHEEARGWKVESVEKDNRGFDLISRKPHPEDPKTAIEVRFIEVKGRAHKGEIALTSNDYNTAKRLRKDYWLYVVFQCATSDPSLNILHDPSKLDWQPIVKVEHYRLKVDSIRHSVELKEDSPRYG
jgi:Domain of unknown function (DUF3883)/Protein of unknown function (DUF1214)